MQNPVAYKLVSLLAVGLLLGSCKSESSDPASSNQVEQQLTSSSQDYLEAAGYEYKMVIENNPTDSSALPMIIVLHSMGSSPEAYMERVGDFDFPCRLIYIKAQDTFEGDLTFFPFEPQSYYEMSAQDKNTVIIQETNKFAKFIEAVTSRYKPSVKPVMIGASQGGDLSYTMALYHPNLLTAAFPLLATLNEWTMRQPLAVTSKVPIRVYHGVDDNIVKIKDVLDQIAFLKTNGLDVVLNTYSNCGHQITAEMMGGYKKEITQILTATQ